MEALHSGEDYRNGSFLALLASMLGALVASFPRRPWSHLRAHNQEKLFPNHMSLINRCQQVCTEARGPAYLERDTLNVYDACTSYFLGLIGAYTNRMRQCFLYFGECISIMKTLGIHKTPGQLAGRFEAQDSATDPAIGIFGASNDGPQDILTQEIGRRLYWTAFVGVR